MEEVVIKYLLLLIGILSCEPGYQTHVPMALRPDTRRIVWVSLDSSIINVLVENFEKAMPNETVMCIEGEVSEVSLNDTKALRVRITNATPAIVDSATEVSAYLPSKPLNGCKTTQDLVGIAHDHVVPGQCNQSDPDANLLFVDTRLLFGLVFCIDGWTQILYQDGRRGLTRWK
jgi:hypothetical protein